MNTVIYAADIGSIAAGNFGWARLDPEQGSAQVERNGRTEIAELVEALAHDLNEGRSGVALGFECPLFVPVPTEAHQLGKARSGEKDRSWSAGPGAGALATGLVQTAWVLNAVRQLCPAAVAYLDWYKFTAAGVGLFLWEAFVTGSAKAATHTDDALVAARTFCGVLPSPSAANAVTAERPMSLLGAAMLWSGWTTDLEILHTPCLVIKTAVGPPRHTHCEAVMVEVEQAGTMPIRSRDVPMRDRVIPIAKQIPQGSWTTYGDIAAKINSHARPVASCLATCDIPNAHRILTIKGRVSDGFAWQNGRTDDPVEVLKLEGVRFTNGRADPRQRWRPQDD